MKEKFLKYAFRRYFLPRIEELSGNRVVRLDYPAGAKPKYTPRSGANPELLPWFQEKLDLALFDDLAAGDILFIDSSHRVYTTSDVTILFLEVVPRLRPGVLLHIHDIFLPWDYPAEWTSRYYSEQYLLASWLLAQPARFRLLMSNAFVSYDPELRREARELFFGSGLAFMLDQQFASGGVRGLSGMSLWLEVM